jgi:hypothetical protein
LVVVESGKWASLLGAGAYAIRVARRKTYSKTMGTTRRFLSALGLSK